MLVPRMQRGRGEGRGHKARPASLSFQVGEIYACLRAERGEGTSGGRSD